MAGCKPAALRGLGYAPNQLIAEPRKNLFSIRYSTYHDLSRDHVAGIEPDAPRRDGVGSANLVRAGGLEPP